MERESINKAEDITCENVAAFISTRVGVGNVVNKDGINISFLPESVFAEIYRAVERTRPHRQEYRVKSRCEIAVSQVSVR